MELAQSLAQLFGGGPQAAFIAIVCVACITLFIALMRAHSRETALAMRVVVVAEKLTEKLPKRRTGKTGAHPVVEASHEED